MSPVDEMLEWEGEYKGTISRWACCISISTGHKGLLCTGLIINPHFFAYEPQSFGTRTRCSFASLQQGISRACTGSSLRKYNTIFVCFLNTREHNDFTSKPSFGVYQGKNPTGSRVWKMGRSFITKRRSGGRAARSRAEPAAVGNPSGFCSQKGEWEK